MGKDMVKDGNFQNNEIEIKIKKVRKRLLRTEI
jgi:hypothetical protein